MFVDMLDDRTSPGLEVLQAIASMEQQGFRIIETTRTIRCTEVHYNGPFHLQFENGTVIPATRIDSEYPEFELKSTHRVVLSGPITDKLAFKAIAN